MGKSAAGAAGRKEPVSKIGFWHMLRDVLVASINKGQFPIALLAIIIICIIVFMPREQVGVLAFKIIDALERGALLGYLLFILAIGGWYRHARFLRLELQDKGDKIKVK